MYATCRSGGRFEGSPVKSRAGRPGLLNCGTGDMDENFATWIWFDGPDDAQGIVYLYAWHRFADRPDFHLWAQYHDRYRRVPGSGWRFAFRSIKVSGTEGVGDREFDMIGRHPGRAP